MIINLIKQKTLLILSIGFFRLLLDFMYLNFISRYYDYSGFDLNGSASSYILSWIILFPYIFIINENIKKPTDYFFMIAITSVVVPLTSLYGLADRSIMPVITTIISFFIMSFIVKIRLPSNIKTVKFKNGKSVANNISWIFIFVLILWYCISGAFKYFNLDFKKVYDFRELSAELTNVGVMSYIIGWVQNIFSAYAMAYALLKRNYIVLLLLLCIQTFFFGISAHKSVFFTPFLVIGVWWYLSKFKTLLIIPVSFSIIVIFSYLIFIKTGDPFISSMFIRRVFFVPAELSFRYFTFFENNQFVYWSNSILSNLIDYPYHTTVSHLIGGYGGSEDTAANNGLVSSGFAHFGYMGVLIYTFIFSIFLKFINYVGQNYLPMWFVVALTIVPLRTAIVASDLFTTLLTHGLIVVIFLLFLSIENQKVENQC